MSTWKEILNAELASVPKGSHPTAYRAAMKRASARYRGRAVRSNPPRDSQILKLAILAGVAYVAYTTFMQPKPVQQPPNWQPPHTGL